LSGGRLFLSVRLQRLNVALADTRTMMIVRMITQTLITRSSFKILSACASVMMTPLRKQKEGHAMRVTEPGHNSKSQRARRVVELVKYQQ
jgi:hypothetical protein